MKPSTRLTSLGLTAILAGMALAPSAVIAQDNHQNQKNTGRNIGIAGGVIALHGLLKHNTTEAVIGAAAGAAGGKMYEDNRKAQSRNNRERARYYRRHHYYHHRNTR